jgi:putative redox protein
MTTARAIWTDGLHFVNQSGSGHTVVTDAPVDAGGGATAPTPVELVLCGLASCTGVDVASILTRMRIEFESLEIQAEAERAEDHPRTFTQIRLKCLVQGQVPARKLEKALALSASKYCSVAAMLASNAQIEHEFEILPGRSGAG